MTRHSSAESVRCESPVLVQAPLHRLHHADVLVHDEAEARVVGHLHGQRIAARRARAGALQGHHDELRLVGGEPGRAESTEIMSGMKRMVALGNKLYCDIAVNRTGSCIEMSTPWLS